MKNFYKVRLLWLVCLVFSLGIITSCEDDEEELTNAGRVELISFGPTGVRHGEEIRLIGRNLDKVEAIEMAGATVAKANFKEHTPELIRLVIPDETMEGLVTLKLSEGEDIVSKTVLSFEVPITITSVTSEARPGDNITITGTKLNWVEGVLFESDTVDEFVSQSATEVVLQVPSNAKTGTLLILGGGTKPLAIETEEELVITLPVLTSLAPNPIRHSADLTLTGTDLDLLAGILFPGRTDVVSSFVSQSATKVVVKVPNDATSGTLTLVAKGSLVEVETTPEFKVILPAITSLPSVRHGENLTITGTNLDLVQEITFGGGTAVSTFVSQSPTELVVKVPDNAESGTLTIQTIHGFELTPETEFEVSLPTVSSFSPSLVDPGSDLTISGSNLDLVKEITFGGGTKVASFLSQSASQIVVTVPNNAQTGTLSFKTTKDFVVATPALDVILPEVTSITPNPVAPGAYLTLNGNSLDLVKTIVFTGGEEVTGPFTVQTTNQIILTVPAAAANGPLKLITHRDLEVTTSKELEIGSASVPKLNYYIYDDELVNGWSNLDGWGFTTKDLANTEEVFHGEKAIKVTFNDQWGALQIGSPSADVFTGYTTLSFRVYAPVAQDLIVQLNNAADTYLSIPAGWSEVEVPIADMVGSDNVSELRIKNNNANLPVTLFFDYIGLKN